jgi:ABC-type nitrate/sulfonate/bicarbonate transport system substrate-binding protein
LSFSITLLLLPKIQISRLLKLGGGSFTTSIARSNGIFAKYGLQIELPRSASGGSEEVRRWLASGELDLADYGVDNAIAMVENSSVDLILVAAAPTELMAQPEIKSLADLRGKTVLVDAPNTQNALALKKILSTAGLNPASDYQMKEAGGTSVRVAAMLKQKEYAATMASGQTAVRARQAGLVSLGTTSSIFGPLLRYVALGGTPKDRVEILEEAMRKVLRDPEFHREYKKLVGDEV